MLRSAHMSTSQFSAYEHTGSYVLGYSVSGHRYFWDAATIMCGSV